MTDIGLIKRIGIIIGVFLVIATGIYFLFEKRRNDAITYLGSNSFVTVTDFSSFPTGLLAAWEDHLKNLDLGEQVSLTTFTYLGSTYSVQNGQQK